MFLEFSFKALVSNAKIICVLHFIEQFINRKNVFLKIDVGREEEVIKNLNMFS